MGCLRLAHCIQELTQVCRRESAFSAQMAQPKSESFDGRQKANKSRVGNATKCPAFSLEMTNTGKSDTPRIPTDPSFPTGDNYHQGCVYMCV